MQQEISSTDRLVPPREAAHIVGLRSMSTFYGMIKAGELPPLIKRGRSSFHLESDLRAYLERLASSRTKAA